MLHYDAAYRTRDKAYRQRHQSTLGAKEKPGACHKVNIATAHSLFLRGQRDDEKRYAYHKKAYDVRLERKACVLVHQKDGCHSEKAYEDTDERVYELGVPVHKEHYDERREQQTGEYRRYEKNNSVIMPEDEQIAQSVQKLDHRVSRGYPGTAAVTFAPQTAPADYRDKVTLSYLGAAGHTVGVAFYQALSKRKTVDADI